MTRATSVLRYTAGEEIADSVTHGIGALLAGAGPAVLFYVIPR